MALSCAHLTGPFPATPKCVRVGQRKDRTVGLSRRKRASCPVLSYPPGVPSERLELVPGTAWLNSDRRPSATVKYRHISMSISCDTSGVPLCPVAFLWPVCSCSSGLGSSSSGARLRLCAVEDQGTRPQVHVISAPMNCFVPDVLRDALGTVHMVYALGQNAEYVQSHDEGASWTKPVRVNSEGTVEFKMGDAVPNWPGAMTERCTSSGRTAGRQASRRSYAMPGLGTAGSRSAPVRLSRRPAATMASRSPPTVRAMLSRSGTS